jgi:hypothetical protein
MLRLQKSQRRWIEETKEHPSVGHLHRRKVESPQDYDELRGIVEVEIEVEKVVGIKRSRRKQQRYRIRQEGKEELRSEGIICWEKGRQAHSLPQIDIMSKA